MYARVIKRMLDFVLALCGIVILSPLLLLLCLVVKLDSPGPVLFLQKRVGRGKQYFQILKFRTMYVDAPHEKASHLLRDPEQYITRVGRFLRKSSLDELPQLFNILAGQMAIVGPRPALWNQFELIAARDRYGANDVRPGLTGLAQVSGRDRLREGAKAWLDGVYVQKLSFRLDCRCFFGAIVLVLRRKDVVEGGGAYNRDAEGGHDR